MKRYSLKHHFKKEPLSASLNHFDIFLKLPSCALQPVYCVLCVVLLIASCVVIISPHKMTQVISYSTYIIILHLAGLTSILTSDKLGQSCVKPSANFNLFGLGFLGFRWSRNMEFFLTQPYHFHLDGSPNFWQKRAAFQRSFGR